MNCLNALVAEGMEDMPSKTFQFPGKFKLNENRLLLKLVLSLLLPSLAILIAISGFFSLTYSRESMRDISANSFALLSSLTKPLDYLMDSARQTTFEVYKSASIFPLISSNVTNEEKIKAAAYLSNMLSANSNIYSIYIFQNDRSLLRVGGSTLYSESDSSIRSFIEQTPILHPSPRTIKTMNGSLNLISIVYTDVNTRSNYYYVVMNLQPSIIDLAQNQKFLDEGQKLIVTDLSGNVLAHSDLSQFASSISNERFFQDARSSSATYGTLSMKNGQKKGIVAYTASDNGKYMAFFISDYDSFYAQTRRTTHIILSFCLAIFLLLITASVFISYKVYSPLNSIFSLIKSLINSKTPGEKTMGGDLRHAAAAVGRVIEKLNRLEQGGNDSERNMKNNFMFRLLTGKRGMTQNEFKEGLVRFLPISGETCHAYQAVVLRIDGNKSFIEANSLESIDFQLNYIESISEHILGENRTCSGFANDTDQIAIFIGLEDHGKELMSHSVEFVKLKETVSQLLSLSLTIGISTPVDCLSLESLKTLYEDAFSYTNYRILYGKGAVYCKGNIKTSIGKYEMVKELSALVIASAKNNSKEKFDESIDRLLSSISSYSYDSIIEILLQLSDQLLNLTSELQPYNRHPGGLSLGQIKQNVMEFEDYSQFKQLFTDQYCRIHNLISALKNSKASDLLNESVEYINTNYSDPTMSASQIAEKLGITPQYFSKLFKQMTAMSFPDYLSDIRLEHAKEMLAANPLMPISSICVKTGYNSASYFSTSFTKKYGIPPSKYILLAKENAGA